MHEMSLMKDLMQKISFIARQNNAHRVISVKVRLGALCHISPQHFGEHFTEASVGTMAQGSRLEIEQSKDETEARAQDILLESVEVESP